MTAATRRGHGTPSPASPSTPSPRAPGRAAPSGPVPPNASGQAAAVAAMCVLAFAPMLLLSVPQSVALRVLAIASISLGLVVFYTHGGRKVTAAGLFCGTAGLMNGSGGWYWAGHIPPYATSHSVLLACLTVFASTTLMYAFFWHRSVASEHDVPDEQTRPTIDPSVTTALVVIGAGLFVLGALMHRVHLLYGTLDIASADVGVIVLGGALMLGGSGMLRRSPVRAALVVLVLLAYYLFVFSGGGRLRLITIAAGLAIVAQYRLHTPLKKLALLLTIPGVLLFAAIGVQRVAQRNLDTTYQASASGLGSLVNPVETYGELISGHLSGSHGSTLVAEAVVLIPRTVWPGKPQQFSREVALTLRPNAFKTNLSMPCLPQGEWYYNFGWLGLIPMVLLLGLVIRWVDRRIRARQSQTITSLSAALTLVIFAVLAGSASDLAWGGTATWMTRNLQRLLLLIPIALVALVLGRRGQGGAATRAAGRTAPSDIAPVAATGRPAVSTVKLDRVASAPAAPSAAASAPPGSTRPPSQSPPAPGLNPDQRALFDRAFVGAPVDGIDGAIYQDIAGTGVSRASRPASSSNRRRRAVATFVDQAVSSLQNFLILFAALHLLSIAQIAQFTLAYTGVTLADAILRQLLLTPLSVRFATRGRRGQREAGAQALGACLLAGLVAIVALAVASFAVSGESRTTLQVTGLAVCAVIVQDGWRSFFFTIARPWRAAANDAVCLGVSLAGLVLLFGHGPLQPSPATLLGIWLLGTGAGAVFGVMQTALVPSLSGAGSWLREHHRLGGQAATGAALQQVAGRIALSIVGGLAGAVALGKLAAGRTLLAPATTISTATMAFGMPEAAREARRGEARLQRFALLLSVTCLAGVLVVGAFMGIAPDWIGHLVAGRKWEVARTYLLPVVVWFAANALQSGPNAAYFASGRGRAFLGVSIFGAIVVLVTAAVGASVWGGPGAAWGLALGQLLTTLVTWTVLRVGRRREQAPSE